MILFLFTAIGFPPCGSGRYICIKIGKRQLYTKGETIHKTIQNTEYTKYKTYKTSKQHKKNVEKCKSSN
jgi:hypothetical protein